MKLPTVLLVRAMVVALSAWAGVELAPALQVPITAGAVGGAILGGGVRAFLASFCSSA